MEGWEGEGREEEGKGLEGEMGEGGGREEVVAEGERRPEREVVGGRVVEELEVVVEFGSRSGTGGLTGKWKEGKKERTIRTRRNEEGKGRLTHEKSDHECKAAIENRCSKF